MDEQSQHYLVSNTVVSDPIMAKGKLRVSTKNARKNKRVVVRRSRGGSSSRMSSRALNRALARANQTPLLGPSISRGASVNARINSRAETTQMAQNYLQAMLDPFAEMNPLPRVPDEVCVRTMATRMKINTSVVCDTNKQLVLNFCPVFNVNDHFGTDFNSEMPSAFKTDMMPLCYTNTDGGFSVPP